MPEMGMVCFCCGDPHHRRDWTWSSEFSLCGQNHKAAVCRKNPNGKVRWEEISYSVSSGRMQMLATPSTTYMPAPLRQQYLMVPSTWLPQQSSHLNVEPIGCLTPHLHHHLWFCSILHQLFLLLERLHQWVWLEQMELGQVIVETMGMRSQVTY